MKSKIFILLLLTGCGYHFGYGNLSDRFHTIDVPFAKGDATGAFTSELIYAVSRSGAFRYDPVCPDLVLLVDLVDYDNVNIGFRYDVPKPVKKTDPDGVEFTECGVPFLVPSETRRFVKATISLYNPKEGCRILGPDEIVAYVEFDHEFNSSRNRVNTESLGQVIDLDNAVDQAARPLNKALAQKIMDYLVNAWN